MKLKELIENITWEEIKKSLIKNYNTSEKDNDSYQYVFFRLLTLEPKENIMRIYIDYVDKTYDGLIEEYPHWDIYGKDGTLLKDCDDYNCFKNNITEDESNKEQTYAIEFTPWNQWLEMIIDQDTVNNVNLTKADIIAHCLNEMTFISFDEKEIQGELSELNNRVNKIKNMTDEEFEKNTVSIDKLMERLKDKIEDGR